MKTKNNTVLHLGFIALAFASKAAHANTYTWNTNTNGALWSASGSWVGAAVPTFAAGDTFDLSTRNITVNGTTSTMDTVGGNTLGTIKIGDTNNTHTWILSLSTALTLDGNGSAAVINQISTSKGDTISGAGGIILASDLNTTNDSGNVLQISTGITATGGTRTITNNGSGGQRVNLNNAIGSGINLVQNSTTSATWMLGASASFDGTITVKAGNFEVGATGANGIALGTAAFTLGDTTGSSDATLVFKSGNGSGYSAPINVASGSSGIKSIFGAVTFGNNTYALNGAITLGASSSATADVTIGNSTGSTSTYNVTGGITGFGNVTVKTLSSGKTRFVTGSINNTGTLTNAGINTGVAQIDAVIGSNVTGVVQNSSTSQMNLTQANTYTGATTVNAGTLALSGSISSSSALALGGGTLSYTKAAGNTQTFASTAVNAGNSTVTNATATNTVNLAAITRSGNGLLNISSLTGTTTTSNAVDSTGILGTWFSTGTGTSLQYAAGGSSGAITAYTGTAAATAANVTDTTGAVNYDVAADGVLGTSASFNTLRYTGAVGSITGDFTANGLMNAGTGTVTYSGNVTIGASNELVILGNTQGTTLDGVISGAGDSSLTYGGTAAGTLALNGANTYTGATTVNAGTLKAGVASVANTSGAFGNNSAVTMANASGATLDITGFNTQIGSLAGGGTAGGNVTLGAATLTTGGDNTTTSYAGVISGASGSLTKIGTGTQTLSGANTYTGATNINAGKLVINGSTATGSAVTVAAGTVTATPVATLGGTGTIGGNVALTAESSSGFKNGGVLAPTASASGTKLRVTGTTTFGSGSIFEWNLNATTTDPGAATTNSGNYGQLAGTGAITGTDSIFNVVLGSNDFGDDFWNTDKSWNNIFTGTGATTNLASIFSGGFGGDVATSGLVSGQGSFAFSGTSTLTWTAVPEPKSALAGLLLGAGLLRRRRKN